MASLDFGYTAEFLGRGLCCSTRLAVWMYVSCRLKVCLTFIDPPVRHVPCGVAQIGSLKIKWASVCRVALLWFYVFTTIVPKLLLKFWIGILTLQVT